MIVTSSAPGTTSVVGGLHGTTTKAKYQYNAQNGAPGTTVTATITAPTGAGAGSVCLPSLAITKSTSVPVTFNVSGNFGQVTSAMKLRTVALMNSRSAGLKPGDAATWP